MYWAGTYLAAVDVSLAPLVSIEKAVASGDYSPEDAAKTRQISVAIAAPGQRAPDFAVHAAEQALKRSGIRPADLGSLFYTYSIHPGIDLANTAGYVAHQLGIPPGSTALHQATGGCHAGLGSIELACCLLRVFRHHRAALVTAADVAPAPVIDRWQQDIALADGGAAAVLAREGPLRVLSTATMTDPSLEAMHRGADPFGPGQFGPDKPLDLDGRYRAFRATIPRETLIARLRHLMVASVDRALHAAGLDLDDLDHVILPFIGDYYRERTFMQWIPFDRDQVRIGAECAQEIGHVTSSDSLIALHRLISSRELRPGQRVLVTTDGSGYVVYAMVVQAVD